MSKMGRHYQRIQHELREAEARELARREMEYVNQRRKAQTGATQKTKRDEK